MELLVKWKTVMQEFCQIQQFQSQTSRLLLQNEHGAGSIQPKRKILVEVYSTIYGMDLTRMMIIGLYIGKSKPNRLVAHLKEGQKKYGGVTHINWLPDLHGRALVVVKKMDNPFSGTTNERGEYEVLDPANFLAVCAYRHLPAWNFKHHQPLFVLQAIPCKLFCHSSYVLMYNKQLSLLLSLAIVA
ncbi:hypothetical protein VP01_1698g1 [Puccinia sorghi]|uniref:Uncharacterized protein n=1 Tax=Puccinia sorghi TaxID=27349 RepID=A0A0L6VFM4_9BASI|nr:hypothetical protein VP01_1698g1 [Puccinia sorghi]